jgi:sec-independent protein translocase protein TatC
MATQIVPSDVNQPQVQPETAPPADGEGKVMGFFDHLDELRQRFIRAAVAIGIGMVISLFFTNNVIEYMKLSYGKPLLVLNPTDSVTVFLKVALTLGAILAMPIITYQVFMFVMPALTRKERRWVFMALPGTTILFLGGIAFTWFFLVPTYIRFLGSFNSDIFETGWTADAYISFVTAVLFWHGVAFEAPVVFYVLARMGLVNAIGMIKFWRQAIVGTAVAAAVITPTVDPVTMLSIMGVLLGLYVASIGLVFVATRINRRRLGAMPS